jgi:hypothetical protein
MRVDCLHGYYKFSETQAGQLAQFANLFGLDLERSGDHFTFSDLVDAPSYSLAGGTFLGCPTLFTMEGPPWEVMRKNKLVYDFQKGLVVPILAIITIAAVNQSGFSFVSNGMILGGSVTEDGSRVTDYAAFYLQDRANFKYSEVEFDSL